MSPAGWQVRPVRASVHLSAFHGVIKDAKAWLLARELRFSNLGSPHATNGERHKDLQAVQLDAQRIRVSRSRGRP